jgi:UDP-N-acetyl-D-mannosaminuronate dehydrogenase
MTVNEGGCILLLVGDACPQTFMLQEKCDIFAVFVPVNPLEDIYMQSLASSYVALSLRLGTEVMVETESSCPSSRSCTCILISVSMCALQNRSRTVVVHSPEPGDTTTSSFARRSVAI